VRQLIRFTKKKHQVEKNTIQESKQRGVVFLVLLLLTIGVVFVADVSSPQAMQVFQDPYFFAKQQIVWSVVGLFLMVVGYLIPYVFWRKISPFLFGITILILILVLLPGLGSKVLGARRWLVLGPVRFQPAEVVKLTLAMIFAKMLADGARRWILIILLFIVGGLIMLQPDLGTTLIVLMIGMGQIFISGFSIIYFLGLGLSGFTGGFILVWLSDYRKDRLMSFINGLSHPLESSYHVKQILLAIGSGGFLGVGLGQSRQKHLFLPETATDSVFAIIAEEIGFVGSLIIIALLALLVMRLIKLCLSIRDDFGYFLAVGIVVWISGQIIVNLTSMVALTPLTGVPLPFFSYGGSSLTMILFSIGILLNIAKTKMSVERSYVGRIKRTGNEKRT